MSDARAVSEKLGVAVKVNLDKRVASAEAVGAHRTLMLRDIEQGRTVEPKPLVGAVLVLGRITVTATATIEVIYATTIVLVRSVATKHA